MSKTKKRIKDLELRVASLEEAFPEWNSSSTAKIRAKQFRSFEDLVKMDENGDCVAFKVARLAWSGGKYKISQMQSDFIIVTNYENDQKHLWIGIGYNIERIVGYLKASHESFASRNQLKIFQLLHREGFINLYE